MSTKNQTATEIAAAKTPAEIAAGLAPLRAGKADAAKLLARIAELSDETLAHPQVVNKTDTGVASRVARMLNKEATPCAAHRFWTGAHVLAFTAKHS